MINKKRKILNLTNHKSTPKQKAAGVIELKPYDDTLIRDCLIFEKIPTRKEMLRRIDFILEVVVKYNVNYAMIGGASYFMPLLEHSLMRMSILPVYTFSERKSIEKQENDGSVRKVTVFNHLGFYSPFHKGPLPEEKKIA